MSDDTRRLTSRRPVAPVRTPGPVGWAVPTLLGALSAAVVVPYALAGPGFFMDDWRDLARVRTVGVLREAELSKLASRPGAWLVNTLSYGPLGDNRWAWLLLLTVVNALVAVLLWRVLLRVLPDPTATVVAAVWVLLPDHTSLRVFANTLPITVSLGLLLGGILLIDDSRWWLGVAALCAGALCYETVLLPGVVAVLLLHRQRRRGTRRQVGWAVGALAATGAAMLIHPTYDPRTSVRGTPRWVLPAHFASGLSSWPVAARLLAVVAAVGAVAAVVLWWRGERAVGSGPWLMGAGLGVMVVGLAPYVLKWPTGSTGYADRCYVVSSVGAALFWVGLGTLLVEHLPAAVGAVGAGVFVLVLVLANVSYQRDWSTVAADTRSALVALDRRYDGRPPPGTTVGPAPLFRRGVQSIPDLFVPDATLVILGHPLAVHMSEGPVDWARTPPKQRITWDDLLERGPA